MSAPAKAVLNLNSYTCKNTHPHAHCISHCSHLSAGTASVAQRWHQKHHHRDVSLQLKPGRQVRSERLHRGPKLVFFPLQETKL